MQVNQRLELFCGGQSILFMFTNEKSDLGSPSIVLYMIVLKVGACFLGIQAAERSKNLMTMGKIV